MTWSEHHGLSEKYASQADFEWLQGNQERATALYALAAEAELRALEDLDPAKTRTLGITAVSAVALCLRAKAYERAEQEAYRWLSSPGSIPGFAYSNLQVLLQMIWGARAQDEANVRFVPGDVLVSVKGGDVVFGGAPLDLVVRKVEEVKALFYRTAEFMLGVPHRKRGSPSAALQTVFQPWLFQAPAGSYQFAVRVQAPPQIDIFPDAEPAVGKVVSTFLGVMKTGVEDPDGAFAALVPDEEYQLTFLKLTRNLAPTGGRFDQIEFKDAARVTADAVALAPAARRYLNEALRSRRRKKEPDDVGQIQTVEGILRGVHLDRDWLEIVTDGPLEETVHIGGIGDVLDDVVGPMVNNRVIATVVTDARGRLKYKDIEPAD